MHERPRGGDNDARGDAVRLTNKGVRHSVELRALSTEVYRGGGQNVHWAPFP